MFAKFENEGKERAFSPFITLILYLASETWFGRYIHILLNLVVAQLVERSLLTPEIRGSNPVIGEILSTNLSANCITEKTKIKKKRPGMDHL